MPIDDAFKKRERFLEEEYFHRREQEFIEHIRQRRARQGDLHELGTKLGVDDPAIVEAILDLGFSGQLSQLLFLTQSVRMAWADGSVSPIERKMIIEMARKDGINEGGMADLLIKEWLEKRPSEAFLTDTLLAIKAVLLAVPREGADARRKEIIERAKAVAAAPEGLLRRTAEILEPEQRLLEVIETALSHDLET
jgi:hypothetical protein